MKLYINVNVYIIGYFNLIKQNTSIDSFLNLYKCYALYYKKLAGIIWILLEVTFTSFHCIFFQMHSHKSQWNTLLRVPYIFIIFIFNTVMIIFHRLLKYNFLQNTI